MAAIRAAAPDAVLFHGQPGDVGRFAARLRAAGLTARFYGFDRLFESSFSDNAGEAAEGTSIPYYFDPDRTDATWRDFVQRFRDRWGEAPDIYAAYGYDGARLMIEAILQSGPNRFRIRDYLAGLDRWTGVTGPMIFDGRWDNIAPMVMMEYRGGRWQVESSADRVEGR
jgi:branched-chain amino acid transport system substrate-binding protein